MKSHVFLWFSHRQWREDTVTAIIQLVVGDSGVQIRCLVHSFRGEPKLTIFIQSCQLTATATLHTDERQTAG